jgi:hypothetical protein
VYVSDESAVWFLTGKANEDFQRDEAYPVPAVPFTDVRVSGKYVNPAVVGDVAIWTGETGICLGDTSGGVINLTESRYNLATRPRGAGFIRKIDNTRHYINTLY